MIQSYFCNFCIYNNYITFLSQKILSSYINLENLLKFYYLLFINFLFISLCL